MLKILGSLPHLGLALTITTANVAFASPKIDHISGNVADGQEIRIHGQDFGSFNGRIISWDDFEAHKVGDYISNTPAKIGVNWTTQYGYKGPGVRIDDEHTVSGDKSVKIDWGADGGYSIRAFGWSGQGPLKNLYISYQRRMEGDYRARSGENHKQFYLFGTGSREFPQFMPLLPGRTTSWGVYNNSSQPSSRLNGERSINSLGLTYDNTKSKFQRWEWNLKLNHPHTEYNGVVQGWVDGKLGWDYDDFRHGYVEGAFDDFRLGHMAQGFYNTAEAWFDDIYIATTPARIELCSAKRWDECGKDKTLLVPQPGHWNANEVTASVRNLAAFEGRPIYLYLVNSKGEVNKEGKLLMNPPKPPTPFTLDVVDR